VKNKSSLFSFPLIAITLCCINAVNANAQGLAASPQQLTFYTQPGGNTPSQMLLISSTGAAQNVTITTHSDTNWLIVTPQSGATPLLLTVSIGASAPTEAVDVGFINVTSTSAMLSVPVTLNASSSGQSSSISANPNSLSFVFPGADAPATQTVALSSSSSSVTNFTATAITNSGTPWLTVNPSAGSFPANLQVTVNPAGLGSSNPGTFNAAVAINAPGTNGISIPVLVTIQGTPSLNVSPAQLAFAYQLGTATPQAQTLTINSSTGANVSFAVAAETSSCGNWIVLNQNTGATPSTLSVQVNTSGLTAGSCSGVINISAPSASNSNIVIPVSLFVSALPLIQVPSTGVTYTYQAGAAIPAPQSVEVTSSTPGLTIAASIAPASEQPNFVVVTPTTGTTPQSLTLTFNPTVLQNLGPGTYTEIVTISSAGAGNSPQTFPVMLTVTNNPTLTANLQSLNFNYQIGETAPQNQIITLTSSGAPLNYQAFSSTSNCAGFLKVTPASGSTFGTQNQVVVSVNPQGISPQVCSGNITLTVPGSSAAPLVIPVTFNLSNTPLLNVSQPSVNVIAVAGAAPLTQTISLTSTSSALAFSATASTNPTGLTWLSVTPNAGYTPNNLLVTINPANLGVGIYNGSISVSSSAENVPAQSIPVTLTIVGSTAAETPTSLTFTQATGGAAPNSQTVQITGVPSGAIIGVISTLLNGTGWLTATASANTVTVSVNGSELPPSTYSGVVTVIVPNAGGSPLSIPVTLNVTSATSAITLSTSSLSFDVLAGSLSVPNAQTVQITSSTGSNVPFTASFVPSTGVNFLTITPSSGNTPGAISVSVNSAVSSTLAAGSYSGQIQVASGTGAIQTVNVTLIVSATGTPVILSITSGASFQPGAVSPGELVTIFGAGIGPPTPPSGTSFAPTAAGTVQTNLASVTVTFNGVSAPLLFVSPGQINAIVPYQIAGQNAVPVVIQNNGTTSASFTVPVAAVAPSIFSLGENGSGQGAILNSNESVNSASNPAAPGSTISIFATGEGQLAPAVTTGCISGTTLPLPQPVVSPISVTVAGQPAPVSYAGEAPGLVCGVIQINAMIPSGLSPGAQPVVLTIGSTSNTGQSITVAVQ